MNKQTQIQNVCRESWESVLYFYWLQIDKDTVQRQENASYDAMRIYK